MSDQGDPGSDIGADIEGDIETNIEADTDDDMSVGSILPAGDWPEEFFNDTNLDEPIGDEFTGGEAIAEGFIGGGQWSNGQLITDNEAPTSEYLEVIQREEALEAEANQHQYNLRQRSSPGFNDAFLDDDKTGDYDPVAERKALRLKKKAARARATTRNRNNQRKKIGREDQLEDEVNVVLSCEEEEEEDVAEEEKQDERGESESEEDSDSQKPTRKPPRKRLTGSEVSFNPTPERPSIGCDACREVDNSYRKNSKSGATRTECSLYKDKTQTIPCRQCKKNGTNCTFGRSGKYGGAQFNASGGPVDDGKGKGKVKPPAGTPSKSISLRNSSCPFSANICI